MLNTIQKSRQIQALLAVCLAILSCSAQAFAMKTEFTPSLYVSGDYTDNHFQTDLDEKEEFYTTYGGALSLGFIEKTGRVVLTYNPEFKDYKNNYEEDTWEHNISFVGDLNPSKRVSVDFSLNYDGHGDDTNADSWEHGASLATAIQLSRHTGLTLSGDYSNAYDRQVRTGEWKESEDTSVSTSITHQFGQRNSLGLDYTFSFDDYEDPDDDEYQSHEPSAFIAFWFTPQLGFDSNVSFEDKDYDNGEDEKIYTGDIRLIKKMTRHFQTYLKYKHTHTDEASQDETVYNPSVGFDWSITEDSNLTLGLGYMIQEWESGTDKGLFVDVDIFKTFDFSRRGSLTVSGSSGYDASGDDSASLGFNVYYEAGFLFNYKLTKRLAVDLIGSYLRDEFDEPDVDRVDNTLDFALTLSWSPLRWINIRLAYEFEDFDTDSVITNDYQENKGTITVRFYPLRPLRLEDAISREDIENRIFKD
jgi:hypothetical protein